MLNKCIFCAAMLATIFAYIGGVVMGMKTENDKICGDVAFYYHNDLPIRECIKNENPK